MADFRGTANEFKETWQREVNFEEEAKAFDINSLEAETEAREPELPKADDRASVEMPAIKEVDASVFKTITTSDDDNPAESKETNINDKKNWL